MSHAQLEASEQAVNAPECRLNCALHLTTGRRQFHSCCRQKLPAEEPASQGGRPDVGEDGVIEEDCVLWHHSHARPQRLLSDIPQVLAVDPDAACCGVIKAEEQPQAG